MNESEARTSAQLPSCSGRTCVSARTLVYRSVRLRAQHKRLQKAFKSFLLQSSAQRNMPRAPEYSVSWAQWASKARCCHLSAAIDSLHLPSIASEARPATLTAAKVAVFEVLRTLMPQTSYAAESLPVNWVASLLEKVEHLGAYGPAFFAGTIVAAEMVPLFPTQPLSIASGLLFGASKGSLLALTSTTTAAALAFQLSRQVGRRLADQVAGEEIAEVDTGKGAFVMIRKAIDEGSFQQQAFAVTLLRLTPVVPFSASNYLLGATPLGFGAYLAGSVVGLSFWCILFATLGSASRSLLESGLGLEELYADIRGKASVYTEDMLFAAVGIAALTLLYSKVVQHTERAASKGSDEHKDKDLEKI